MHHHDDSPSLFTLVQFAREHRKHPTRSELTFWRAVCQRQLGVRVRRQHPMHPYIVDFYVAAYRLVIEIDGGAHASEAAQLADARRDAELVRTFGVRVLRLPAELVENELPAALAIVRRALG